jgi:hypothetical protein
MVSGIWLDGCNSLTSKDVEWLGVFGQYKGECSFDNIVSIDEAAAQCLAKALFKGVV